MNVTAKGRIPFHHPAGYRCGRPARAATDRCARPSDQESSPGLLSEKRLNDILSPLFDAAKHRDEEEVRRLLAEAIPGNCFERTVVGGEVGVV